MINQKEEHKTWKKGFLIGGNLSPSLLASIILISVFHCSSIFLGIFSSPSVSATSLTLSIADTVSLDIVGGASSTGVFASSSTSDTVISVKTDNYTGYTLGIAASNSSVTALTSDSGGTIPSITSAIDESTFSSSTSYNNKWGYRPSKFNSTNNTNYLPAPSASTSNPDTLDQTSSPNPTTANTYNIAIGARVNNTTTPGTYTNSYVITAVANGTPYTLTYNKNAGSDTASNMPTNITNGVSYADTINLGTTTPTRTGYTFAGWCTNNSSQTSCNSTLYNSTNGNLASFPIDRTASSNSLNVYAIWTANNYTCTKRYRLQNADGTWGSYQSDTTEQVAYGSTCSYSKSVTNYKNTASGTNGAQASTSCTITTSGCTASLSFYRNTYTLTVSRNTTYISSASATTTAVHGTNYYRWGQGVSITATASSGNEFTSWSQSGTAGTFANANNASTTFTMGKGNATVTAGGKASCTSTTFSGYMQSMSASTVASACVGDTGTLTDRRDSKTYKVAKLADNNLWMTENLAIDLTATSYDTLYGTGTNAGKMTNATSQALKYLKGTTTGTSSDQWAMAAVTKTWTSRYSYSQPWIAVDSSTSGVCNDDYCVNSDKSWSSTSVTSATINGTTSIAQGKIGVYYNYCAASAGSYCYGDGISTAGSPESDPNTSSLRDITSDICPYGWRLPTSGTSGEFYNLYTQYSSNVTNFQTALSTPLSGGFSSGKAYNQGMNGYFWSSTWHSTYGMYHLIVNSSRVYPSVGHERSYGYSVRCIYGAS